MGEGHIGIRKGRIQSASLLKSISHLHTFCLQECKKCKCGAEIQKGRNTESRGKIQGNSWSPHDLIRFKSTRVSSLHFFCITFAFFLYFFLSVFLPCICIFSSCSLTTPTLRKPESPTENFFYSCRRARRRSMFRTFWEARLRTTAREPMKLPRSTSQPPG